MISKNKPVVIQLGVAVSVVIFIIISSFNIGLAVEKITYEIEDTNRRVDHLSDKYISMREDMTVLQGQNSIVNTKLATLEVILTRVETSIIKLTDKINN